MCCRREFSSSRKLNSAVFETGHLKTLIGGIARLVKLGNFRCIPVYTYNLGKRNFVRQDKIFVFIRPFATPTVFQLAELTVVARFILFRQQTAKHVHVGSFRHTLSHI